jgi:hypothetical protein
MFAAAANGKANQNIYSVTDAPVRPHLAEFMAYCAMTRYAATCTMNAKKIIKIKLVNVVDPSDPNVIGLCIVYGNLREIRLQDKMYFPESIDFKFLVWHELGHCLMDLPHIDNRPHIMNSVTMPQDKIVQQWVYLIRDFFYGPVY